MTTVHRQLNYSKVKLNIIQNMCQLAVYANGAAPDMNRAKAFRVVPWQFDVSLTPERELAGHFICIKNESLENHWLINYLNMHGIVLYMPLTLIIILNHTFCYAGYLKSAFLFKSLYQDVLKHYFYKALSCQPAVPS